MTDYETVMIQLPKSNILDMIEKFEDFLQILVLDIISGGKSLNKKKYAET